MGRESGEHRGEAGEKNFMARNRHPRNNADVKRGPRITGAQRYEGNDAADQMMANNAPGSAATTNKTPIDPVRSAIRRTQKKSASGESASTVRKSYY